MARFGQGKSDSLFFFVFNSMQECVSFFSGTISGSRETKWNTGIHFVRPLMTPMTHVSYLRA